MNTKPTPEVYLSNFLFCQGYHGWVTFPMFLLPFPKLFWYGDKQLYTHLSVIVDFCPQGLQRLLKYLLTSYLLIFLSGGGVGLIFVFVFIFFLSFSKFKNTVFTSIVCSSGLAGGHSFTWPLAIQSQHGQLDLALSFTISYFDNSHKYEVLRISFLAQKLCTMTL